MLESSSLTFLRIESIKALLQKWYGFPRFCVHEREQAVVDATHEIAAVMGWSYPYTRSAIPASARRAQALENDAGVLPGGAQA